MKGWRQTAWEAGSSLSPSEPAMALIKLFDKSRCTRHVGYSASKPKESTHSVRLGESEAHRLYFTSAL